MDRGQGENRLAHKRGNLDQLADLPFRQGRLQISRGYRLLHDRIETDDPVRRQHVLREEFIAQPLSESFRYASELGVTFERVRAGIHPVDGLAIGLHEACKNILASTLVITTRTVSRRMARTSLARATTRIFPCSMASTPNGASAQPTSTRPAITWLNVAAAPPIAVGRALSPNCLMRSNTSYRLDGLLVQ